MKSPLNGQKQCLTPLHVHYMYMYIYIYIYMYICIYICIYIYILHFTLTFKINIKKCFYCSVWCIPINSTISIKSLPTASWLFTCSTMSSMMSISMPTSIVINCKTTIFYMIPPIISFLPLTNL